MVMRWILFGVLLAGLVRAFVSPEHFGTYFGPTLAGLGFDSVGRNNFGGLLGRVYTDRG